MTINKIYEVLTDYMDKSLAIDGEADRKAKEALAELKELCWRPVAEGEFPEVGEDGESELILVSFENFPNSDALYYKEDAEGGAFYSLANGENPVSKYGFIVNAWRPLDRWEDSE